MDGKPLFHEVFKITLASLFLVAVIFVKINGLPAWAGASHNVSGFAWSSNIGWISFNNNATGGGVDYGVRADASGNISGYAWSPNIGWVSFNPLDLSGCPATATNPLCAPKIDMNSREISGWARACAGTLPKDCTGSARSDGWDGWISLRGASPDYGLKATGPSSCYWSGFAWGSSVLGWIKFSGSNYGVSGTGSACGLEILADLTVSVSASPSPAQVNTPVVWTATASGGVPPYTITWSGSDGLSGSGPTRSKTYTTQGVKTGSVVVRDSNVPPSQETGAATLTVGGVPQPGIIEQVPNR